MSTKVRFGNKIISLPGSYSRIISGENNPPRDLDYGKLLIPIMDNTYNSMFLGGSGINGELASGKNSIYRFTDINDFKDFVGYKHFNRIAEFLFNPDGAGNGVSEIIIAKACTTTCAEMGFYSTGGKLIIKTRDESLAANGVTDETLAQSTITISNAGSTGNKIDVVVLGRIVATYTNASNDNVATFVAGLADSVTSLGICELVSENATSLVIKAPKGTGNITIKPTITATGTAAGNANAFSGGANSVYLSTGYAYTIETGVKDPTKWVMKIWRGTFVGNYSDGFPFNEISLEESAPKLIAQSIEFDNMTDLTTWARQDSNFGKYFEIDSSSSIETADTVVAGDITNIRSYQPAIGGTEVYGSTDLDDLLDAIQDVNYNLVLATWDTSPVTDPSIVKLIDHISVDAKYIKHIILGGSNDNLSTTIGYAKSIDSERVFIVHGEFKKGSQLSATGFRVWDSFYHAAIYAGRILGLAPEVPITFKSIRIDGIQELSEKQRELADDAGVIVTYYDSDFAKYICLHGVNTLQENDFVLNRDGKSHLIQIERIKSQLDKELIINSKLDLLTDPNGVNRNTLSKTDAEEWTKVYLQRKLGSLIIDYRNVVARSVEDVLFVDYEASPNTEVKGLFFTGKLYIN